MHPTLIIMGATLSSIFHIDRCSCGNGDVYDLIDDIASTLTEMYSTLRYLESNAAATDSEIVAMRASIRDLKSSVEGVLTLIIDRALPALSDPITPVPSPDQTPRTSVEESEVFTVTERGLSVPP